jgi:GR25 family glycosyltransferase involved in LPS biosynthesis
MEQYGKSDLRSHEFTRIDAVDGKKLDLGSVNITKKAFDEITQIEKTGFRTKHYQLTRGAIGCYLSHMIAFDHIANGDKEYGLIFEDDVVIDKNIIQRLNLAIEDIPNNWDMLFLGCICIVCDKYDIYYDTHRFFLAHCYVVKKSGAIKLKALLDKKKISQQIDSELSDLSTQGKLRIYCLREALSKQSGSFQTTIQTPLKVMPGIDPYVPVK